MALTQEQLRQGYFEAIKDFTNNFTEIELLQDAPLPIQIAVEKMEGFMSRDGSIVKESISDLSLTFADINSLPKDILMLIMPYCNVRW